MLKATECRNIPCGRTVSGCLATCGADLARHNKTLKKDKDFIIKMLKNITQVDAKQQPQLELLWEDKEVKFDVSQL